MDPQPSVDLQKRGPVKTIRSDPWAPTIVLNRPRISWSGCFILAMAIWDNTYFDLQQQLRPCQQIRSTKIVYLVKLSHFSSIQTFKSLVLQERSSTTMLLKNMIALDFCNIADFMYYSSTSLMNVVPCIVGLGKR